MAHWLARLRTRADMIGWSGPSIGVLSTLVGVGSIAIRFIPEPEDFGSVSLLLNILAWVLIIAGIAAIAVGVFSTTMYAPVTRAVRRHARRNLVDGGLLYAAIEHEPAEALKMLKWFERWSWRGGNPAGGLSFRGRIRNLLRSYYSSAAAIGKPALPPRFSPVSRAALVLTFAALALLFAQNGVQFLLASSSRHSPALGLFISLRVYPSCMAIYAGVSCLYYTLVLAQSTGVTLAICDVLGADAPHEPAAPAS